MLYFKISFNDFFPFLLCVEFYELSQLKHVYPRIFCCLFLFMILNPLFVSVVYPGHDFWLNLLR